MEGGLAQPHTGHATRRSPVDHRLHQSAADALVLHSGLDRYRPDPDDRGSFVEEVAADDLAVALSDHAIEPRMIDQHPEQPSGDFGGGEVAREPVLIIDRTECIVTDATTRGGIVRRGRAQRIHDKDLPHKS